MFLLVSCSVASPQSAGSSSATHSPRPESQQLADDELERARRLLQTPQFQNAADILDSYLQKNPESADAHALKGLLLYREHHAHESMAEYLRASQLGELSAFDLRMFALDCAAIPDLAEAEKWLQRSIEMDDHDAATWEALGHVRFSSQKYEGAIEALEHALTLAPRTVSAESLIGLANERLARFDAAEAAYRQAIQWQAARAEKDPVPFVGLGRVLVKQGRPADAIPSLLQATKSQGADAEVHELLGLAYEKSGRAAEAATQLETAVRLQPDSARLHMMLARTYHSLGETEKAEAEHSRYDKLKASGTP